VAKLKAMRQQGFGLDGFETSLANHRLNLESEQGSLELCDVLVRTGRSGHAKMSAR